MPVPWVRRLGKLIGTEGQDHDLVAPVRESELFEDVEEGEFRIWQRLDRDGLLDLVRSRSAIATLDEAARLDVLAGVMAMYDEFGRGHDGMLLPYLTQCYRAVVRHPADIEPEPERARSGFETTGVD